MEYRPKEEDIDKEHEAKQGFKDLIDRMQSWNEDDKMESSKTKDMLKEELETLVEQYKTGNSFTKKIVAKRLESISTELRNVNGTMQGERRIFLGAYEKVLKESNKYQKQNAKFSKGVLDTIAGKNKKDSFGSAIVDSLNPFMKLGLQSGVKLGQFLHGYNENSKEEETLFEKMDSSLAKLENYYEREDKRSKTREVKETLDDMNRWQKKFFSRTSDAMKASELAQNRLSTNIENMVTMFKIDNEDENGGSMGSKGLSDNQFELIREDTAISHHYLFALQILSDNMLQNSDMNLEYQNEILDTLNIIAKGNKNEVIAPKMEPVADSIKKMVIKNNLRKEDLVLISEFLNEIWDVQKESNKSLLELVTSVGTFDEHVTGHFQKVTDLLNREYDILEKITNIKPSDDNISGPSNPIGDSKEESQIERLYKLSEQSANEYIERMDKMVSSLDIISKESLKANEKSDSNETRRQKEHLENIEITKEAAAKAKFQKVSTNGIPVQGNQDADGSGIVGSIMSGLGTYFLGKFGIKGLFRTILPNTAKDVAAKYTDMASNGSGGADIAPGLAEKSSKLEKFLPKSILNLFKGGMGEAAFVNFDESGNADFGSGLKTKSYSDLQKIHQENQNRPFDVTNLLPKPMQMILGEIKNAQKKNDELAGAIDSKKQTGITKGLSNLVNNTNVNNSTTNVYSNNLDTKNRDKSWSSRFLSEKDLYNI